MASLQLYSVFCTGVPQPTASTTFRKHYFTLLLELSRIISVEPLCWVKPHKADPWPSLQTEGICCINDHLQRGMSETKVQFLLLSVGTVLKLLSAKLKMMLRGSCDKKWRSVWYFSLLSPKRVLINVIPRVFPPRAEDRWECWKLSAGK